jgi:hypothetical protein
MNVQTAAAVAAALVSLAFSMATFERWLERHRRHELAWSFSLLLFALASGALSAGAGTGWNGPTFRLFYLFGAIANVPFLALGTIYLLAGVRAGDRWGAFICLFTAFAAGVMAVAPLTGAIPHDELPQGSEVFGPLPRILAGVSSGVAATVVVAGAVWSAVRLMRTHHGGRLVLSNGLIAVGTLITGASGLLNSVVGQMTAFAVTLLVGITVIFAGFLVATSVPRPTARRKRPASRPADQSGPPPAPGAATSRPSPEGATARS